jgi:YbgC/YbaW family acyl-CoA thioester hydrolase
MSSEPLYTASRTVAFQDIDAAGVVFFVRFFEYFHDAFFALLAAHSIDLPSVITKKTWGAPVAHAEADYTLPLRFGDAIEVHVVDATFGTASVTVNYRVTTKNGRVACTGRLVHVFVDPATGRPGAIPDAVRAALA